jgi:chromosome segregation ATPase
MSIFLKGDRFMPTFEPEDFLAALRRLYDSQLKFDEGMRELKQRQVQFGEELRELKERQLKTGEYLDSVGSYVRETAEMVRLTNDQMQHTDARLDQLVGLVKSHEERLQRLEIRPG